MGRRGRKAILYEQSRGSTVAREALERRWQDRWLEENRLAALVTSDAARYEPYHRWLHFRQGFAPGLVREFLDDVGLLQPHAPSGRDAERAAIHPSRRGERPGGENPIGEQIARPASMHGEPPLVLDPFSGSGTTVLECARRGISAVGIEAEASLAFVVNAAFVGEFPPVPDLTDVRSWQTAAAILTEPVHRAALLCAVAWLHRSSGRPKNGGLPFAEAFAESVQRIQEDLRKPLSIRNHVNVGDARRMGMIGDESIRGILTSPPYLSRYDYPRMFRPLDELYRVWFPTSGDDGLGRQLPAAAVRGMRFQESDREIALPEAVVEAAHALELSGQLRVAALVRSYFRDLFEVLRECGRVLIPGGTCRLVVGGARLHDVYIPTDLVVAEFAESIGFRVEGVLVARRLIPSGRKLGRLYNVSPRESVITLTLN